MIMYALEKEDILKIMAKDIDNDNAYIRIDSRLSGEQKERLGSTALNAPKYLGPFSLYEPY